MSRFNSVSLPTRRNMARVLVASGEFSTVDIDRALGLPDVTAAGFLAAMTRYGKQAMDRRDVVPGSPASTRVTGARAAILSKHLDNLAARVAEQSNGHASQSAIRNPEIATLLKRINKVGDTITISRSQCPANVPSIYENARKKGLKVSVRNTDRTTTVTAVSVYP